MRDKRTQPVVPMPYFPMMDEAIAAGDVAQSTTVHICDPLLRREKTTTCAV